ncbi:MAG: leucine-rich repeat domain-containing protein [Acidobacteria bacterium]|nr:leucine-rich repeat domain-containing protein [Acidobacteriota bacterium]
MRKIFLFLCAFGLLSFSAWTENYYIDHVAEENWTTSITVYNDGPDDLTFDLQRWDDSGAALTTLTGVSVPANSSTTLTNTDFGYNGTAMVVTPLYATLVVKLSYRYQDSHSLCEFFIREEYLVKHWMLPNPYHGNFDWFGVAVANFTGTSANVTLTAWHNGAVVATVTEAVSPHTKLVDVSSGFWSGVNYADVDMVTMDSDVEIPAPLSITGNTAQDRHVFFLAENEVVSCPGIERVYAIPHVAESNWTTLITAYNNEDAAQSFTFSSWNGDGTTDVTARVVSIPAHGSAVLTAGTDFVYSGTASIVTSGCMHFKLSYQYGSSESLCEFLLSDADRVHWFIPNSIHDWFNWFGVALCNPTDSEVVVTLDAYKDGQLLATAAKTLAPHTKTVGLSSDFWPDITAKGKDAAAYSDVDLVAVRSSAPIPKPLSITGNTEQDRHVFFLAESDVFGTDVPDKKFWNFLLENFDTDHDGALSEAERNAVTHLDTPGHYGAPGNIRSIQGIQMFPNLQYLTCNYEDLYWLPDLSSLTQLLHLWANNNHLIQIHGELLPDSLAFLGISSNQISTLTMPNPMPDLTHFYADNNQLATFPDLTQAPNLEFINVSKNQLTDISSLTVFTHMTNLDFHSNQVATFPDITGLTDLQSIVCWDNQLTTLPDLTPFTNLTLLSCARNTDISTIPGLSSLTNLQTLQCYDTLVTDLSGVAGLTNLQELQCQNNGITTLPDLSALTQLRTLIVCNNPIPQIPGLSSLASLQNLNCLGTLLTDLSGIGGLTNLKNITCNSSPITTLPDLSALDALTHLECSNCSLTDIPDVTGCASIDYLRCNYNNFGQDDCATINAIEAMGLTTFVYNPQKDGSTLTCP